VVHSRSLRRATSYRSCGRSRRSRNGTRADSLRRTCSCGSCAGTSARRTPADIRTRRSRSRRTGLHRRRVNRVSALGGRDESPPCHPSDRARILTAVRRIQTLLAAPETVRALFARQLTPVAGASANTRAVPRLVARALVRRTFALGPTIGSASTGRLALYAQRCWNKRARDPTRYRCYRTGSVHKCGRSRSRRLDGPAARHDPNADAGTRSPLSGMRPTRLAGSERRPLRVA